MHSLNLGISAHGDARSTRLTERFLYHAVRVNLIDPPGSNTDERRDRSG
jgi:hypothetical protein